MKNRPNGSKLVMSGFLNKQLHRNESIKSDYIKELVIDNFYLRLYKLKQQKNEVVITINSIIKTGLTTILLTTLKFLILKEKNWKMLRI